MDPNEVRLRQARAQQAAANSPHFADSPNGITTKKAPHGGDMDPHEVRIRRAHMQQTSGSSFPSANNAEPNNTLAPHGEVRTEQAQVQPAQYGSGSHWMNMPHSPLSGPSGYNTYQSSQSPQNPHPREYFPAQNEHQDSYPNQAQQSAQSPHPGLPTQVSYCLSKYEK